MRKDNVRLAVTSDLRYRDFHVGFSADFCDPMGVVNFPDLALSLLDRVAGLSYEFVREYASECSPEQLRDCDAPISREPRIAAGSPECVERLCAAARCGVGYGNVDLRACAEHGRCDISLPAEVIPSCRGNKIAPIARVLDLSHFLCRGSWPQWVLLFLSGGATALRRAFFRLPHAAAHWIHEGFHAIRLGSDIWIFMDALRGIQTPIRTNLPDLPPGEGVAES